MPRVRVAFGDLQGGDLQGWAAAQPAEELPCPLCPESCAPGWHRWDGGQRGRHLLEVDESLVGAESCCQSRHPGAADGIALETDTKRGALGRAALGTTGWAAGLHRGLKASVTPRKRSPRGAETKGAKVEEAEGKGLCGSRGGGSKGLPCVGDLLEALQAVVDLQSFSQGDRAIVSNGVAGEPKTGGRGSVTSSRVTARAPAGSVGSTAPCPPAGPEQLCWPPFAGVVLKPAAKDSPDPARVPPQGPHVTWCTFGSQEHPRGPTTSMNSLRSNFQPTRTRVAVSKLLFS